MFRNRIHPIKGLPHPALNWPSNTRSPAFNAEFSMPAAVNGTAFVAWFGGELDDILCEQHERTVGKDNTVSFEGMKLQILADDYRCHYVKAKVRVHRPMDGCMAIFHGPRKLAEYDKTGCLKTASHLPACLQRGRL